MLAIGDHLRSPRGLYDHHGVYVGGGQVVHYAGERSKDLATAQVRLSSLDEFRDGNPVEVVPYGQALPPMEVVARAFALLGEARYHLVLRNCEHLATLAKVGVAFSRQVDRAIANVGTPLIAQATAGILAAGAAANLAGAAQTMSALGAAGALVGGGPLAGVAVTGAAVGATSLVTLLAAYRDDPYATAVERAARAEARSSAWWALGIGALAAAGFVLLVGRGRGAALVSSGLKAVGSAVGGGMAAGVAIATGAPLVGAAVAAKKTYVARTSLARV